MIEKVSVMEEDWDYLIILDACRYDYFSMLYKPYLSGELKKVLSYGSSTIEWCKNSFQEKYDDVVYISSNPFINSYDEVLHFNARERFHRVIDVWDWGWNETLGTVLPKTVNHAVQTFKDEYRDRRFIIHYLQPHEPYLGHTVGYPKPKPRSWVLLTMVSALGIKDVTRINTPLLGAFNSISKVLEPRVNVQNLIWKIGELLKLPPASPTDAVRRRFGNTGLREAYAENLRLVLTYVARLVEDLSGVIIVTADHGECLGEEGAYSHPSALPNPLLLEVPWFKVEKVKK